MITTTNEIYAFVELAIRRCHEHGCDDIAQQLDDAMHLGSLGMEILGAIKAVFVSQFVLLKNVVEKAKIEEVIAYADKAFGLR